MKTNFWNKLKKPFFVLAPMEDVTDIVFRKVIKQASTPDVFFTEFTNSDSYAHSEGINSLRGRLKFDSDEKPIVAHLWGDNPENFEKMSYDLKEMGFDGIDINMGCPAPKVFKHGRGAGLILRPEVAADIIAAAKKGGLPVSVKTRLAHSKIKDWKEWISHLLKQDLANLSVHLRTKTEMSKYPAHYELIPEIMKLRDELAPNTLITINGDIDDYKKGMELYEKYNVDGIMIGRGVFHNPFAFDKEMKERTAIEHIELFKYHLDLYDKYTKEEPMLSKPLFRFFKIYIRNIEGASNLRTSLMDTKSTDEIRKQLNDFMKTKISQE